MTDERLRFAIAVYMQERLRVAAQDAERDFMSAHGFHDEFYRILRSVTDPLHDLARQQTEETRAAL